MTTYDIDVEVTDPVLQTVHVTVNEGLTGIGIPAGGSTDQALVKTSGADYAVGWDFVTGVPDGGVLGQLIRKDSATNGDATWDDQVVIGNPLSPPSDLGIGQLMWDGTEANPVNNVGATAWGNFSSVAVPTTIAAAPFGTSSSDPVGAYTFVNATGRIVITEPGLYHIDYVLAWNNTTQNAGAYYQTFVWVNGVGMIEGLRTAAGLYDSLSGSTNVRLVAGDYIQLGMFQSATGSPTVRLPSKMTVTKLRN